MEFAKYRSLSLKLLWPKVEAELNLTQEDTCRLAKFSTWEIDNICANNWKANNPTEVCAGMLFDYIEEIW